MLALCAWLGQWLPAEDPGAWASFVVIYLFILAGMTAGYTVYYKKTAGGMTRRSRATASRTAADTAQASR